MSEIVNLDGTPASSEQSEESSQQPQQPTFAGLVGIEDGKIVLRIETNFDPFSQLGAAELLKQNILQKYFWPNSSGEEQANA
jgi:hypothetical protein